MNNPSRLCIQYGHTDAMGRRLHFTKDLVLSRELSPRIHPMHRKDLYVQAPFPLKVCGTCYNWINRYFELAETARTNGRQREYDDYKKGWITESGSRYFEAYKIFQQYRSVIQTHVANILKLAHKILAEEGYLEEYLRPMTQRMEAQRPGALQPGYPPMPGAAWPALPREPMPYSVPPSFQGQQPPQHGVVPILFGELQPPQHSAVPISFLAQEQPPPLGIHASHLPRASAVGMGRRYDGAAEVLAIRQRDGAAINVAELADMRRRAELAAAPAAIEGGAPWPPPPHTGQIPYPHGGIENYHVAVAAAAAAPAAAAANPSVGIRLFREVEGDCAICLMPLKERGSGSHIVSTSCGHIFHEQCLQTCVERGPKKCPECRQAL